MRLRSGGGWGLQHCKGLFTHVSGTCAGKTQQLGAGAAGVVGDLWTSFCIGLVSPQSLSPAWWLLGKWTSYVMAQGSEGVSPKRAQNIIFHCCHLL